MNLDTFRLFCDVVRCRSFSQGGAANGITQSAASQAVSQLERYANAKLIDRSKRPFILTPEGQVYFDGLSDILRRHDTLQAKILTLRQEMAGRVHVAAIYSVGLHDMSQYMQTFMSRYPKAKLRLEFLPPKKVYEAVLTGESDLGILSYPAQTQELAVISLRDERMVFVCHPGHHLAKSKKISPRQLHRENFVAFENGLMVRKEIDRYLARSNVAVRTVMEFDNIETIKQAIEIAAGVSILPEPTVQKELKVGTLAAIPLSNNPPSRPIGVLHRQRQVFTPVIEKFIELLKTNGHETVEVDQASGSKRSKKR